MDWGHIGLALLGAVAVFVIIVALVASVRRLDAQGEQEKQEGARTYAKLHDAVYPGYEGAPEPTLEEITEAKRLGILPAD